MYREFIQEKDFDQFDRSNNRNPFANYKAPSFEHEELRWNDSLGPTYSRSSVDVALKNRYEKIFPSIQFTLPRLLKIPEFRQTISKLRQEGWLDWHILTAISGATMNERFNRKYAHVNDPEKVDVLYRQLGVEKEEWEHVPLARFDEDVLRFCLYSSMPSTLAVVGLESHQVTSDFPAIEEFLRHRYNYWTDDLPHMDPFPTA